MKNKHDAYKGFETWRNALLMTTKMQRWIIFMSVSLSLSLTFLFKCYFDKDRLKIFLNYAVAFKSLESSYFKTLLFGLNEIFLSGLLKYIFLFIVCFSVFYGGFVFVFWQRSKKQQKDVYVRGAKIVGEKEFKELLRPLLDNNVAPIPLGNIFIPSSAEVRHFLAVGQTGAGKTQTIKRAVTHLQKEGRKLIVLDLKADYLPSNFNEETDLIFNPFDKRSVRWTLFNDVEDARDIRQVICHGLIRSSDYGQDPFWSSAAIKVFDSSLFALLRELYVSSGNKTVTNKALWDFITSGAAKIATALLNVREGREGREMLIDVHSKQTQGIMAKLLQHVGCLGFIQNQDGDFSIRKWISNGKPGTLYVVGESKSRDLIKPLLTLLIDMASHEVLSWPNDYNRRIYFFLDEFSSLNPISSLVDLIRQARSKGASVWIGTQDIGQIEAIYGHNLKTTIVNSCVSKIIFSIGDPDTAEYLSRTLGETEVDEAHETLSFGLSDIRDGLSYSRNTKIKRLVLPSELHFLPSMEAYVKLPDLDITKVTIPYIDYKNRVPFFIKHPEIELDNILFKYEDENSVQPKVYTLSDKPEDKELNYAGS